SMFIWPDAMLTPLLFSPAHWYDPALFLVLMLLPLPFAAYIDILLEHRYQRYYNAIRAVIAVTFIVISALYFSDVADFNETMPLSNLIAGLVALFLFAEIIFDTFVRGHRENKIIAIGFSIFVMLCILEIIHLNLTVHPNDGVFVAMGLLVLLVVAVTYEVKRISELRAETLEAQKANQAKTTFLANMSHEIRTPINAILGMDELILREDTSPSVREYALNIKSAGTALLEIISDVLDFSKIEQGKMEIINAEYDSRLLLNSIITMIKVRTEEKGLNFVRNISPELPSKLVGDEKHIREVMINLLSNAVKYTPKGSVTFTVRHEKKGDGRCDLFISVKDTGIGIKESDMGRLFNQFERLDQKKTRSVEGTGLGLAISANLIRLMEGDIECESVYGKGSEFTVRLPQIITDETPIGDIGTGDPDASLILQEEEPECLEGIKVLVVDDNAMNLKVARGLLKKLDAEVASCRSGAEMLEIIKRKKFDVILLDHLMPEMDGIETLEKARSLEDSLNKDTPFIALTANAIAGAREMYLENGFSDYLSKPMTLKELSDTILSDLGRKNGA
ncbi:MAG: response regulator, partial [Lachnospiraceae bacterium]|nr:response regulator [Lachnospiraceae bacterium]